LTAAQARKVIAEMVAISSGETLSFYTVRGWLNEWLTNKVGVVSERMLVRYRQVVRDFLTHLGSRAEASITSVSPGDIISFRNKLREEGRSVSTCNGVKNVLSVPFEAARKLGLSPSTRCLPWSFSRNRSTKSGREPFTAQEVARLVESAKADWRGAVLLAATTGLRLADVANLCWECVDMEHGLLRIETRKTGRLVVLPIHPDFATWLSGRPRGIGKAPVFPELAGKRIAGDRGLSVQFREIATKAGIMGRVVTREGKGRTTNSKTFHGLRHSFISLLANAGVAPELRQRLAGHSSAAAHGLYTHHEIETLRGAIAKLPRLSH
jgi:integrase